MASIDPKDQDELKSIVQSVEPATQLEHLVAALLGELIGTSIAVAKSGFQHGADAGTTGRQQRYLRIECKRYRDTTSLNERELLGEMDHAFARDPALEVWVLAATREVSEQLEKALSSKGEGQGVPVVVLDWKSHETPTLAVLMASHPALVESFLGREAGEIAARIQPIVAPLIDRLRRDLAGWQIGSTTLRRLAWERLRKIWQEPRESRAHFGQIVSGGSMRLIHRSHLLKRLDAWWAAPPALGSPVCVNGLFGVGKTWVVTDWLMQNTDALPSVLLVPASALPGPGHGLGSAYGVKTFLAQRLQELTQVRDVDHWRTRLERMLLRPAAEGCALVVVFDGMSQQPGVEWIALLNVLQAEEFRGRIRVLTTTRSHHFHNHLRQLAGLEDRAVAIEVDVYDAQPGGEFDQMLALLALSRADLHPDLHTLARNPRLFDLVIRFRERLVDGGAVTLHRLLWEYGRDSAGESMNRTFSAPEWEEWLQAAATNLRDGIHTYTTQQLGDLAKRSYLDDKAIYQRLSEIIDTPFVKARPDRTLELSPEFVAHALGATAVFLLASAESADRGSLESTLAQWLDPIAGLDQRAEILQAAVAIALETRSPRPLLGVLTAAWLQTQNLAQTHIHDAHLLAAEMPEALLDAIELSSRHTHAASQKNAVSALRQVDRGNTRVRHHVLARADDWLRVVSRDVDTRAKPEPEAERHRHVRLMSRLGVDRSGPLMVLGELMQLVDRDDSLLAEHIPALLEGYPLREAMGALRIAAIAASVAFNHAAWNQLRWVCLLNPIDPQDVAAAARKAADEMRARSPEPGIHPKLGARVAQLLLHLTGHRRDDEAAAEIDAGVSARFTYDDDYLADPTRSLFSLERRHALGALNDTSLGLRYRVQRCGDLWLDPTFKAPPAVCQEVAAASDAMDVERLYTGRNVTVEAYEFDQMQSVLARCAPHELAALRRRLVRAPATQNTRAARSWHMNHALLVYGPEEGAAAREIRVLARESRDGDELHAASELLLPELMNLDAFAQAVTVVEADLDAIPTSITDALHAMSSTEVDLLIGQFQQGTSKQQRDVVALLVTDPPTLSDSAWGWLLVFTASDDEVTRRMAYMALAAADARRLGHELDRQGWRFTTGTDALLAHVASGALFAATTALPFEQVAVRLAPWRLLEAVRHRGGDASEIRTAAELLDAVLTSGPVQPLDVGAQITIRHDGDSTDPSWYSIKPHPLVNPQPTEALRDEFDLDAQLAAQQRASEVAEQRIRRARQDGASLFLEFVSRDDALALCRHAPEVVQRWIAGHEALSADFRERVQQAEGLLLAVCEAMLTTAPETGVRVWHALQRTLRTRILGAARIPALLHMLFRAPASPAVLASRETLLDLTSAHTDADLYEVALVAALNGQSDWLEAQIARDAASGLPLQMQRAATLAGFRVGNTLPVPDAWPEGPSNSWAENVSRRSARLQYFEACARYWWNEYWRLEDLEQAYAAWVLFCECADRRALAWMESDAALSPNSVALQGAKRRHWNANRVGFKQGADQSGRNLARHFLARMTEDMVWPWRTG